MYAGPPLPYASESMETLPSVARGARQETGHWRRRWPARCNPAHRNETRYKGDRWDRSCRSDWANPRSGAYYNGVRLRLDFRARPRAEHIVAVCVEDVLP